MDTLTPHPETRHDDVGTATAEIPSSVEPPPSSAAHGHEAPGRGRLLTVVAAVAAVVSATVTLGAVQLLDGDPPVAPGTSVPTETDDGTNPSNGIEPVAPEGGLTVAGIAETVAPSVAGVEVSRGGFGQRAGEGSAVIFDAAGYLLTNNHVVEGASAIEVILPDGQRYDAEVIGTDPRSDLAVLKVDATGLPAASFATEAPQVGETVVAIGSPFGLDGSVTSGIISALDRDLQGGDATLVGMIQTDAAINPGNSGGALVNDRGQVVGINTAIVSGSGSSAGVGFAIPSTVAMDVAEEIRETGRVRWAYLGIRGLTVDPEVAQAYGLETDAGAAVDSVEPGSAAADAGLQPGDIVVGMDGEEVASMEDLAAAIRAHDPGDDVTLDVLRDGATLTLDVTFGEATD